MLFKKRSAAPAAVCVLVLLVLLAIGASAAIAVSSAPSAVPEAGALNPAFSQSADSARIVLPSISSTERVSGLRPSPQDLTFSTGMQVKTTGVSALSALPSNYDLRSSGRLTAVRDQGSLGTCWAFATFGSLESYLQPALGTGAADDFSEDNLALTSGFNYPGGSYLAGGQLYMSTAYLSRWGGPVWESEDAYGDSYTPAGLTPRLHAQNVDWIPARASATDNDNIKNAVVQNGGLYVAMYWSSTYYKSSTYSYYFNGSSGANHAVVIVGWDDNYAASNFASAPAGPGAFIVRNSWGTAWGQGGYFYVSYYDSTFGRTDLMASFDNAESTENYAGIYQYDPLGNVNDIGYGSNTGWFANNFTAQSTASVGAVGFYTLSPSTTYQVYTGATLASLVLNTSGTMAYMGFHTVPLATPLGITAGQKFVVAVKVTSPGTSYPIAFEYAVANYSSAATAAAGQSYISSNGATWTDLTSNYATGNVCLKAYVSASAPVTTPSVTSVAPAVGVLGGGNTVVITGARLSGATGVTFGDTPATIVGNTDTQITVTAPAALAAGIVRVKVTTPGGDSPDTAADDYTYVAVPAITSISPATGPSTGGTSVTIDGSGFVGVTAVKFGESSATSYTVNSSSKITAVAPAGSGTVQVQVTAAGGSTNTAGYTYTVAATRYQQNATGITYGGTWATVSTTSASGSSYTRSSTSTASITFAFTGASVSLVATKGSTMGKINVSVDGGTATVVDLYRATTAYQQTVFTAGGLAAGLHTVKITKNSGTYINLDALDIVGTIATAARTEQSDSHLLWGTTWTTVTGSSYSGSSMKTINNSTTGTVTIKFTGVSLNVIATKGRAYGKMSVSIDGGTAVTVDLYSYSTLYKQTVFQSGMLLNATHTVVIKCLGTKNTSATATTIDVDAFDIIGAVQ